MPCDRCGSILLLGIDGEIKRFCPNCEGIIVIDKKDSLSFNGNLIPFYKKKIEEIFRSYEKKSIIGSLIVNRELEPLAGMFSAPFHSGRFLASNLALWYAFNFDRFGTKKVDSPFERDYQKLLYYAEEIIDCHNFIYLISANFGAIVEIPEGKDPHKYLGVKNALADATGETSETFEEEMWKRRIFKFTEKWEPVLQDYKKFGLSTEVEVNEAELRKRIHEKKLEFLRERTKTQFQQDVKIKRKEREKDNLQSILSILNLIELGDLGKQYIRFDELKDNLGYNVGLLKILSSWAVQYLEDPEYRPLEKRTATLKAATTQDLSDFFKYFATPKDVPIFFDKFVSNYNQFSRFPLVVKLDENEFLIPPYTLFLIANFLTFKYLSKEKINQLKTLEGYGFEPIVSKKLKNLGFTIVSTNFKDNPLNPTLEIDIIAYYKDVIFVIECKSWALADNFLSLREETRRKKDLNNEISKQKKRLNYVKTNLSSLGFNKKQIKDVKSVVITKLHEQIQKINDSIILPFDRIEELLTIEDLMKQLKLKP
jgi:Holliday junction resolvase-like predicted endonuclease